MTIEASSPCFQCNDLALWRKYKLRPDESPDDPSPLHSVHKETTLAPIYKNPYTLPSPHTRKLVLQGTGASQAHLSIQIPHGSYKMKLIKKKKEKGGFLSNLHGTIRIQAGWGEKRSFSFKRHPPPPPPWCFEMAAATVNEKLMERAAFTMGSKNCNAKHKSKNRKFLGLVSGEESEAQNRISLNFPRPKTRLQIGKAEFYTTPGQNWGWQRKGWPC